MRHAYTIPPVCHPIRVNSGCRSVRGSAQTPNNATVSALTSPARQPQRSSFSAALLGEGGARGLTHLLVRRKGRPYGRR